MAFLRISIPMKRINPETGKLFKRGDVRKDGYRFLGYVYSVILKNGFFKERWASPQNYNNYRLYNLIYKKQYIKNENKKIKQREYHKKWSKNNTNKLTAKQAKRQAEKLNRTPKWLTKDQLDEIEDFYIIAKMFQIYTGEMYHVDHILPLKGKRVSGLHVPWNLQVLHWKENLKKSNKH